MHPRPRKLNHSLNTLLLSPNTHIHTHTHTHTLLLAPNTTSHATETDIHTVQPHTATRCTTLQRHFFVALRKHISAHNPNKYTHCTATRCSTLQRDSTRCNTMHQLFFETAAYRVHTSVLQCAEVCCSVLTCVAVC